MSPNFPAVTGNVAVVVESSAGDSDWRTISKSLGKQADEIRVARPYASPLNRLLREATCHI
jgi:hypothetical protein